MKNNPSIKVGLVHSKGRRADHKTPDGTVPLKIPKVEQPITSLEPPKLTYFTLPQGSGKSTVAMRGLHLKDEGVSLTGELPHTQARRIVASLNRSELPLNEVFL